LFCFFLRTSLAQNHESQSQKLYDEAIGQSDQKKKISLLNEAIRLNPLFNVARLELSKLLIEKGEYSSVIAHLDSILNVDRKIPEVWFFKGMAHLKLAELVPATKSLFRAVQLKGDVPQYYIYYGQALFEGKNYEDAKSSFEAALSLAQETEQNEQQAEANYWIGRIHHTKNEIPEAEKFYRLALQKNSDKRSEKLLITNFP